MYQFVLVAALVSAVSADMIDTSGCGRMEKIAVHNQWRWMMAAGEMRFQFNRAVWNRLAAHRPETESMSFGKVKGSDLKQEELQTYASRVLGAFDSSLALLDQEAELERHLDYLHNRNEEMALDSRVYKIIAEEIQNEAAARLGEYYAKTYWPACINFIKARVTPTQLAGSPQETEDNEESDKDNAIEGESEEGLTTDATVEGESEVAITEAPDVLAVEPAADAPVPENLPEVPQPQNLPEISEPASMPEVLAEPANMPEVAEPGNMPEVLAEPVNLPEPANVPVNLPEVQPVNLPEPAGDEPVPETLPEVAEPKLQPAMGESLYRRFFR